VLTTSLAHVLLSGEERDLYARLLPSLTALFEAEQTLITATTLSLDEPQLDRLGYAAEELFEVHYGRGELSSERGLSQMGEL
jgi:hypothetical protein